MMSGALERHGRIDILVNNAGITRDQLLMRMKRRGLGPGDRDQSDRRVRLRAGGHQADDQAAQRAHHQHQFGRRAGGKRRTGELCGVEGGADRVFEGAGARSGVAEHYRECRGSRPDRHRHDPGDHRTRPRATGRRRFRSAGWAPPDEVAAAVCFSPRMRRRILQVKYSRLMVECTCNSVRSSWVLVARSPRPLPSASRLEA